MFKSEKDLKIKNQDLSCVWIRANENPDAPLVCIWTDAKMRAFEEPDAGNVAATVESGAAEEGPGDRLCVLAAQRLDNGLCFSPRNVAFGPRANNVHRSVIPEVYAS
jgi:hypothetical protein